MSINTIWRYLVNTFEVNTRGSHVKMLTLSTDTHAKLKAEESNPAIADIILIYEPVFFAYRDLDQQYGVRSGEYQGTTLGFEQQMDLIPLKLRQWESMIRFVYIEDSPEEKAIFPNKRVPFESGTYESRLDALGALKLKTAADPALAAANAQITSFYNAALGARLVQQTSEGSFGQLGDLRENQRMLVANELEGVLGQLMFIHRHNLIEVERYFDLSLLTDTGNTTTKEIEGNVPTTGIHNIPVDGIEPTDESMVTIEVTGDAIALYAAPATNVAPAGPTYTLAVGTVTITMAQFSALVGFSDTNIYLNVVAAGSLPAHFKITFTNLQP